MGKDNVVGFRGREADADPLTELLRVGARQLIHQAVEAELQELLVEHSERCR
jgi:putative transposase